MRLSLTYGMMPSLHWQCQLNSSCCPGYCCMVVVPTQLAFMLCCMYNAHTSQGCIQLLLRAA